VFSLSKTFFIAILFTGFTAGAQEIVVPLPYGNMDEWITRSRFWIDNVSLVYDKK